jgi:Xaa-Pro aminopeptidase
MNIDQKIRALRSQMAAFDIQAYIIPTADPHQSEYVPSCWMDREWLTGFTGSAGLAVVTQEKAALWTDSRYFIQAEEELRHSEFNLHKQLKRHEPEQLIWLIGQLKEGDTIGINGFNFTKAQVDQIKKYAKGKIIKVVQEDLISLIWEDRPEKSMSKVMELHVKFAGKSRKDKIAEVKKQLHEQGASSYLVTALDEIAWVTNLRGSDVDFNPVFIAYLLITEDDTFLYTNKDKFDAQTIQNLESDQVHIKEYGDIEQDLSGIYADQKVALDKSLVNNILYDAISADKMEISSIIQKLKGVKNETELKNWEDAMVMDGVALTYAFYWLEQTLQQRSVSEAEFADKIAECRSQRPKYVGESFPAIVGYEGNGAIIHYHADKVDCAMIKNQGVLLCDSGGQYLNGTTDITRTVAFSKPGKALKDHFTLVLKGMIGLTQAIFPEGTTGGQLDLLARQHLWSQGLDFPHGTGHGVGFFLNVHEGPQGFAPISTSRGKKVLEVGMVTTNEPGYYIQDQYGIRIENLLVVVPSKFEGFLKFDTMTLFPIDQTLIDETAITSKEKAWFNNYHFNVWNKLSPHLDGDVLAWLKRKCKPLN